MRRISRTITRAGVFLAALGLAACEPANQDGETNTATSAGDSGGAGGKGTTENLTPDQKYMKMVTDCQEAGKGEPLAKIVDAVALINKLPKPLSIPCFVAAIPRPIELAATVSSFSAQPAKDKVHPRYIIHTKGLLITVAAEGFGKTHVEFGELTADSTESVKGDLTFPVKEEVGPEAPYVEFFDKTGGKSSCALCHANERLVGNGYPAEATISEALAPPPDKVLMRYDVESLGTACEGNLSVACILTRAIFLGGTPAEYKIPASMPIP